MKGMGVKSSPCQQLSLLSVEANSSWISETRILLQALKGIPVHLTLLSMFECLTENLERFSPLIGRGACDLLKKYRSLAKNVDACRLKCGDHLEAAPWNETSLQIRKWVSSSGLEARDKSHLLAYFKAVDEFKQVVMKVLSAFMSDRVALSVLLQNSKSWKLQMSKEQFYLAVAVNNLLKNAWLQVGKEVDHSETELQQDDAQQGEKQLNMQTINDQNIVLLAEQDEMIHSLVGSINQLIARHKSDLASIQQEFDNFHEKHQQREIDSIEFLRNQIKKKEALLQSRRRQNVKYLDGLRKSLLLMEENAFALLKKLDNDMSTLKVQLMKLRAEHVTDHNKLLRLEKVVEPIFNEYNAIMATREAERLAQARKDERAKLVFEAATVIQAFYNCALLRKKLKSNSNK